MTAIVYLILDARCEKVRHDGAIVPCALLTAIGVGPDGKRSILGCSVQLSEAETHWRSFLLSLVDRGMRGVKLLVSDNHAGLKAAGQAVLAGVPWQRCQFHRMQNAMAHVPKIAMRAEVAADLRRVFAAGEPAEAERRLRDVAARYQKAAPQLAAWLEENVPEALTWKPRNTEEVSPCQSTRRIADTKDTALFHGGTNSNLLAASRSDPVPQPERIGRPLARGSMSTSTNGWPPATSTSRCSL